LREELYEEESVDDRTSNYSSFYWDNQIRTPAEINIEACSPVNKVT